MDKVVYDKSKFKVRTCLHWTMIHWIINPGFVINELVLGQCEPIILLVDLAKDKPINQRQFVPCPHCAMLHDKRKWSNKNAFKNWFGLYCPNCGQTIPCIHNLTSLLIIILSSPIWIWFVRKWKENWLKQQPSRFENTEVKKVTSQNELWLKMGFGWGGQMFVIMTLITPLLQGKVITPKNVLIGFVVWILGGFAFGYNMKYRMGKKNENKDK